MSAGSSGRASGRSNVESAWRARIFEPLPVARVAILRVILYVFTICDLFFVVNDVIPHVDAPHTLYRPLNLRAWLHLPPPASTYVQIQRDVIIGGCVVLILLTLSTLFRTRPARLPERAVLLVAGLVVAAAFTDWVAIGMSYGKIDHDHFALIVALWLLPSVGFVSARDRRRSEAAGWALLAVQVGCVAIYFLSAWAKIRFGGWDWVTGYTFAWAMTRRGTGLGRDLLDPPWLLQAGQFSLFALELTTPLLLVFRRWWRYAFVAVLLTFHLITYLTMKIHFLPLVVCLMAFLPLETWLWKVLPRTPEPSSERFDRVPTTTG